MEITKKHKIGIIVGLLIIASAFFFKETPYFVLIIGGGIIVGVFPFVLTTIAETRIVAEKEQMFLEERISLTTITSTLFRNIECLQKILEIFT